MFGITTFLFTMGIIALVLWITLEFQLTQTVYNKLYNHGTLLYGCDYAWLTIACLMVRLGDGFVPSD